MFSPFWRSSGESNAYADGFEDQPPQGGFYKWGLGVAVPLLLVGYGVRCLILHVGTLPGRYASMDLAGLNANAFGVAVLSIGIFLHCHYFWGNVYDQHWVAVLGKIISAAGFIIGIGVVIVRVGMLGRH